MNNVEKTLKISILGKSYTVVTDEQDVDVYAAASMVDKYFQEKGISLPAASQGQQADRIAVVVALQIAIELVKAKNALKHYENSCAGLTGLLSQNL